MIITITMNNKYPYLPEGRIIKYVSIENTFMQKAKYYRDNYSTDHFHPTGAVVVKDGKIIAYGANKSKLKFRWMINLHKKGLCVRKILKIKSGEKYWLCPGCSDSKMHAETSAVNNALKTNTDISDADLYLYGHWWCCKPCWDSMIKANIKDVFLLDESDMMFK